MPYQSESDLRVSEEWINSVASSVREFCEEIRNADPNDVVMLLLGRCRDAFRLIQPFLADGLPSKMKILEIGSGYGFGLCYLLKQGFDAVGIEPGSTVAFDGRFTRAIELIEYNGINAKSRLLPACGEDLPFNDNTFDIVFSISVIEHVDSIKKCLKEALRVVKRDGIVIMRVPNYNSFFEGHYNIAWIPYILKSKKVAKWFVRNIFRRHDYFIDELNFTTPGYFKRLLNKMQECKELQVHLHLQAPFSKISESRYCLALQKSASKKLWINNIAVNFLGYLGFSPSFKLILRKS